MKKNPSPAPDINVSREQSLSVKHIVHFKPYELGEQFAFSLALRQSVPVLLGSSELTSSHLPALARRFFNRENTRDRFLSLGHAGFQSLGILSVLAANRAMLKGSKLIIILSPGWFESQYCKGTSVRSFLEFVPPNYLYQIKSDTLIDERTRTHLRNYISLNYDKISRPDPTLRLLGERGETVLNKVANAPFSFMNKFFLQQKEQTDLYLVSQKLIVERLERERGMIYNFQYPRVNWDSLMVRSREEFRTISNNNSYGVENNYYDVWLKNKRKKKLTAVERSANQEFKDLEVLARFLHDAGCSPLFVIMPLNPKAHQDISVLKPIVGDINALLKQYKFKTLDMFSGNVDHYDNGVLEDIMHPYNLGWYQIDKFILDNYHD